MAMLSFSLAAIVLMARFAARALGLRFTIAGIRMRISGLASRRSLFNQDGARKRKTGARSTCAGKYGLEDHVRQLLAGGNWNNGTNCGSRYRNANNYRWNTNTNIGARFASDTGSKQQLHLAGSFGLVA
jgi:hypothetical protein